MAPWLLRSGVALRIFPCSANVVCTLNTWQLHGCGLSGPVWVVGLLTLCQCSVYFKHLAEAEAGGG